MTADSFIKRAVDADDAKDADRSRIDGVDNADDELDCADDENVRGV